MLKLFYTLTGGRPMAFMSFRFTDIVNGQPVNWYRDKFGRDYLAHGPWSLFRVGINSTVD